MNTVTRKIQIFLNEDENRKEHFNDIYRWQRICVKAANMISTAHYVQGNIQDLFYLEDGTKKKLADINKDADGILTMSSTNTTYQLLSRHFKGECPMGMLSSLNSVVQKTFKKESIDVKNGKKSLRTYRDTIPMPLPSQQIRNIQQLENGNFRFMAFGKNFVTHFGRDRSNNRTIFQRAVSGKYKLCDSSIQIKEEPKKDDKGKIMYNKNGSPIKETKMFLLAVFQFESEKNDLDENKLMYAELSPAIPIIAMDERGNTKYIGSTEEFLHPRLQIQAARKRASIAAKYCKGGKGRKKKLKSLEHFEEKEANYIKTKLHAYSKTLIDHCLRTKSGRLVLVDLEAKAEHAKSLDLVLRNWSYHGLKNFIEYKAKAAGVKVEYATMEYDPEILTTENSILNQILTI